VAGGCILALCCDRRYLSEGRCKMGLDEAKKAQRVMGIKGEVTGRSGEMEDLFLDCWYSKETRTRLEAAMGKC